MNTGGFFHSSLKPSVLPAKNLSGLEPADVDVESSHQTLSGTKRSQSHRCESQIQRFLVQRLDQPPTKPGSSRRRWLWKHLTSRKPLGCCAWIKRFSGGSPEKEVLQKHFSLISTTAVTPYRTRSCDQFTCSEIGLF